MDTILIDAVWLVTHGEYSDYKIIAIFDSEEKAIDFKNSYVCSKDYDIEKRELNKVDYKDRKDHFIRMAKDGTVILCLDEPPKEEDVEKEETKYPHSMGDLNYIRHIMERSNSFTSSDDLYIDTKFEIWDNGILEVLCKAKDKKHAIKIANKYRLTAIAENRWE